MKSIRYVTVLFVFLTIIRCADNQRPFFDPSGKGSVNDQKQACLNFLSFPIELSIAESKPLDHKLMLISSIFYVDCLKTIEDEKKYQNEWIHQ